MVNMEFVDSLIEGCVNMDIVDLWVHAGLPGPALLNAVVAWLLIAALSRVGQRDKPPEKKPCV
jgi:hypothetical protein